MALGLLRRLSSAYALAILLEDMRRRELVPELGDLRLITPATGDLPPGFDEDWDRGTAKTTGAITEWQPPHHFVDRQLRGPYTLWHHTHTFEELNGGTLCLDHVRYRPRGGALVHWLFVRRDVERIFTYRQYRLKQLFPPAPPHQA